MPTPQEVLAESTRVATEAARIAGLPTFQPGAVITPSGGIETTAAGREALVSMPSISSPAPAPTTPAITDATPTLPTPEAPQITEGFFGSLSQELKDARTALESAFKQSIADSQTQIDAANKRIADFTAKQEEVIGEAQELAQPFREELETAERGRLHVTENFEANQTLTNELGSLLTEGNLLIQQQKDATGLAAIRDPRIAKTISDVSARAGILNSVMAARNNQIGQALNLIDRSVAATTADKQDQLNYYSTLFDFYTTEKDTEGKRLVSITKDRKEMLTNTIDLLKNDLATVQNSAENIKTAMQDPATALLYAQAGINLNMTIPEINEALAEQAYLNSRRDQIREESRDGKTLLTAEEANLKPRNEIFQVPDAKGQTMFFWDKAKPTDGGIIEEGVIFSTPDGEDIDITKVAGIQRMNELGFGFSEIFAFLDENAPKLTATAINNLLKEAGLEVTQSLDTGRIPEIIEAVKSLTKAGTATKAQIKAMLENKKLRSKGVIFDLTSEQANEIWNGVRGFFSTKLELEE